MSVIGKRKLIDKIEYTIYGADAEMAFKVLSGDIIYKLLGKKREIIEDSVFESLNDNERTSYIAASDMSVEILKKVMGINIETLYDKLKDFENKREFYKAYREHVVHQWRVFILGLYLFETVPTITKIMQQKYDKYFAETWAITSLCHDIGYLLERGNISKNDHAIDIVSFLNSLEENQTGLKVFCPELDLTNFLTVEMDDIIRIANIRKYGIQSVNQLFHDRDNNNLWKLSALNTNLLDFEKYYKLTTSLETKSGNRATFIDHGIASSAILVYLMERKDHWIEQIGGIKEYQDAFVKFCLAPEYKYDACRAIALHNVRPDIWDQNKAFTDYKINLKKFKIKLTEEPLACLLILCDCLQEWGRPCRDFENKLKKDMASQDIHIIPNNNKILLCFPTDKNANSAESTFNRITAQIKKLVEYENDAIELIEFNAGELVMYVDDELWLEDSKSINSIDKAYKLYIKGKECSNNTLWEDGKRLHIDAAKIFKDLKKYDWASRSFGRAAVNAIDLGDIPQANDLLEKSIRLNSLQGIGNCYWILEHCVRKDESIDLIEEYFDKMLSEMKKIRMIDDDFIKEYEISEEEKKFELIWDKLILLFINLLEEESDWPSWAKSDKARQCVLLAERTENKQYLKTAEKLYQDMGLKSYAAWTKSKFLFLEISDCNDKKETIEILEKILEEGKKILQTPGGPNDIVRFSIKVNAFFYDILMYVQLCDDMYISDAKVCCSAIDTFRVSNKFMYKELCENILKQIEKNDIDEENLLNSIKNAVTEMAWLEKNKMKILLR